MDALFVATDKLNPKRPTYFAKMFYETIRVHFKKGYKLYITQLSVARLQILEDEKYERRPSLAFIFFSLLATSQPSRQLLFIGDRRTSPSFSFM